MSRSNKLKRKSRKSRQKSPTLSREFQLSIGMDPNKKPSKRPGIKKVTELPKTSEYMEAEREQIIEDIFEGDLNGFLKRYFRISRAKPICIHSELVPKWRKSRDKKDIIRWLNKNLEWPKHKAEVIYLLKTLERFYDAEINKDNVILAYEIWDLFDDEITIYFQKAWSKLVNRRKWDRIKKLSKEQALKEQLALGYIHVNEFDEYDRKAAHVYSSIKKSYLYPKNFYYGAKGDSKHTHHIYIGFPLVGIEGFTRLIIPD